VAMDRSLACADCGQQFAFTANEQDFYTERGFSEPRRCPACRQQRKAQRGDAGASTSGGGGGYQSGSSSYGTAGGYGSRGDYGSSAGGSGGGYGSSGGRSQSDRAPREMFDATCSSCGQVARVPFRPTQGKPVYCNDCFSRQRG